MQYETLKQQIKITVSELPDSMFGKNIQQKQHKMKIKNQGY